MSTAIGPSTAAEIEWFTQGLKEILPCVGFKPKTQQKDDGIRMLPPPSLPSAIGIRPALTA